MRVLHLIKSLDLGGAENLLLATARRRSPPRRDVRYSFAYFVPWKDALVEPIRDAGAEVTCFPVPRPPIVPLRVPAVASHIRRHRIDLVHCHLPLAGVTGRLAGALAGVPVVYTEHNLLERYHPLTRWASLSTWRMQRAVVAVSDEVARSIERHLRPALRDHVPVRVVANGVPVDRLVPDPAAGRSLRAELGMSEDVPVVGQVAVFRTQKRLDVWLRAAGRILEAIPDARFLLVGDGPLRSTIEREAERLGLLGSGKPLVLPGLRDDVRPWLAAMDLLMISSDFEGLPLVLLEAMAMMRPVVATEVGGISQAVIDGETGRLVPSNDPDALAAAAVDLLRAPRLRLEMGTAARRRAGERFGTDRMLEELETLYGSILELPMRRAATS